MKFVPPIIILLFAVTMLGVWKIDTRRRHLLLLGLSFVSFALALLIPVSLISDRMAITSPLAAVFHLAGALLVSEGILMRIGKHYPRLAGGVIVVIAMAAVIYFSQNDTSYGRTAPTVNLALGTIFAILCVQGRDMARRNWLERVMIVALVLFSLHFFAQFYTALQLSASINNPTDLIASPYWQGVMISGSFMGVFVGLIVLVMSTYDVVRELQDERDADPLTGVLNRRGLERHAHARLAKPSRSGYGVIIADIDFFKAINDELGHTIGDRVLVEFAQLLQTVSGDRAIVGRVGGEEFVLLVRGDAARCVALGQSLREQVARYMFTMLPKGRRLTCSFGIAMVRQGETLWQTAARADLALMRGKDLGRNRVIVEGEEFPENGAQSFRLTG